MRRAGLAVREMNATTQVVTAPISTYHVKAIGVAHQTPVITSSPAIMPVKVSRSRIDGASVPSRKAPSTAPDANDNTAKPASSTERFMNCAPIATASCTTPHATVACFETRICVA